MKSTNQFNASGDRKDFPDLCLLSIDKKSGKKSHHHLFKQKWPYKFKIKSTELYKTPMRVKPCREYAFMAMFFRKATTFTHKNLTN